MDHRAAARRGAAGGAGAPRRGALSDLPRARRRRCSRSCPSAPTWTLEPDLALALFVAPVLLDAAFDTSLRDLRAQLACRSPGWWWSRSGLTTAAVACGRAGCVPDMPWAAAIALGAIVAPPDAAAATAVLRQVKLPPRAPEDPRGREPAQRRERAADLPGRGRRAWPARSRLGQLRADASCSPCPAAWSSGSCCAGSRCGPCRRACTTCRAPSSCNSSAPSASGSSPNASACPASSPSSRLCHHGGAHARRRSIAGAPARADLRGVGDGGVRAERARVRADRAAAAADLAAARRGAAGANYLRDRRRGARRRDPDPHSPG